MPLMNKRSPGSTTSMKSDLTIRCAGALVLLLILGALAWGIGIFHTDQRAVLNQPLPDDAYYYFSLARNAALGKGWVVAGTPQRTTGFQPLWAFILTVLWSALRQLPAAFLIVLGQGFALTAGMATSVLLFNLIKRTTSRAAPALLAVGAFLFSPQIIRHHLNGMETFFTFLGVAGLSLVFIAFPRKGIKRWQLVAAGLLCGLLILARTDMLVWVFAACLIYVLTGRSREHDPSFQNSLLGLGLFGVGLLLPLLPWWTYSLQLGQGLIPESGEAVRVLSLLHQHLPVESPMAALARDPQFYLSYYLRNALRFFGAWGRQVPLLLPIALPLYGFLGSRTADILMTICSLLLMVVSLVWARRRGDQTFFQLLSFWWTALLGLTLAYAVVIQGQWFYHRYAAPLGFAANLALLVLLFKLEWGENIHRRLISAVSVVLVASYAALISAGSYRWLVGGPSAVPDDGFYRAAQYIGSELPATAKIGAFQGGLLGFYAQQRVIPLDGKVNVDARNALVEKAMFRYVCSQDIAYIVDWQKQIENLLVRRSASWDPDRLEMVHTISVEGYEDIEIYRVDRSNCAP
jgi:hypothetical protein